MTILSPTAKLIHGSWGIAPGARVEISSRATSSPSAESACFRRLWGREGRGVTAGYSYVNNRINESLELTRRNVS